MKEPKPVEPLYVSGIPLDNGDSVVSVAVYKDDLVVATRNGKVFLINIKDFGK
jgi:hypothetical protein